MSMWLEAGHSPIDCQKFQSGWSWAYHQMLESKYRFTGVHYSDIYDNNSQAFWTLSIGLTKCQTSRAITWRSALFFTLPTTFLINDSSIFGIRHRLRGTLHLQAGANADNRWSNSRCCGRDVGGNCKGSTSLFLLWSLDEVVLTLRLLRSWDGLGLSVFRVDAVALARGNGTELIWGSCEGPDAKLEADIGVWVVGYVATTLYCVDG